MCDILQAAPFLFMTQQLQQPIFCLHRLSRPGIRASQKLITDRFVWPGINKAVRNWAKTCQACWAVKVTRRTAVQPFQPPDHGFDHVHLDGPLVPCQGFKYLLTCVDQYSRWTEATTLQDIMFEAVVEAFVATWVLWYSCPLIKAGNSKPHFFLPLQDCSAMRLHNIEAYHTQTNGMVGPLHQQLEPSLTATLDRQQRVEWKSYS